MRAASWPGARDAAIEKDHVAAGGPLSARAAELFATARGLGVANDGRRPRIAGPRIPKTGEDSARVVATGRQCS